MLQGLLSPPNEPVVSLRLIRSSRSRVLLWWYLTRSNILKSIAYIYIFLREEKNLFSEKKKNYRNWKIVDNVVHRLSIEFKKRSAPCRRKKELQFNSPREKKKKRKKIGRLFEGRKFLLSNESFSFVSVTKERKKKRLGERLVNDGHNCGLLSQ